MFSKGHVFFTTRRMSRFGGRYHILNLKLLVFFILLALLSGCATPYQPEGLRGGYSETQLSEDMYRVDFSGNGYTDQTRAADFALLRAAEIARSQGVEKFAIVDADHRTQKDSFTTPQTSTTTGSISSYGNTGYFNAQTTTYGGQTFTVSKPRSQSVVLLVRDPDNWQGPLYDAQIIYTSLRQKYGID